MTKLKRKTTGRALFYHRDSGGKHEQSPAEYVRWAQGRANELGLGFRGTPEQITAMIRQGRDHEGDIFLDFNVKEHLFSRRGLDALRKTASEDLEVSHILIPRRDRFARPDNFMDGVNNEDELRWAGLWLVFKDKVCPPHVRGERRELADGIMAIVDYAYSGQFRHELAQKMIYAQLSFERLFGRRAREICLRSMAGDGSWHDRSAVVRW